MCSTMLSLDAPVPGQTTGRAAPATPRQGLTYQDSLPSTQHKKRKRQAAPPHRGALAAGRAGLELNCLSSPLQNVTCWRAAGLHACRRIK